MNNEELPLTAHPQQAKQGVFLGWGIMFFLGLWVLSLAGCDEIQKSTSTTQPTPIQGSEH